MSVEVPSITNLVKNNGRDADPRSEMWDVWAPNYPILYGLHDLRSAADRLVATVPETQDRITVLDAGCGNGEIIERLVRRLPNAVVWGVDYSKEFLKGAQERIGTKLTEARGRVTLARIDLTQNPLPLPAESFDRVISNLVLQYLDTEEQQRAIQGIAGVLKQGGSFHLSIFLDGQTFGQVVPGVLGREIRVYGNPSAVAQIKPFVPITQRFEDFRQQGLMSHPSLELLEDMHMKAGFRSFEVAGKMFDEAGVFTIATK